MNNSEKNTFTGEIELLLILLQRYRGDTDANKQFVQEVLTIYGQDCQNTATRIVPAIMSHLPERESWSLQCQSPIHMLCTIFSINIG